MSIKKVLIFHPTIAPYRIDFFNDLSTNLNATIYLYYENLLDQKFDYDKIKNKFCFSPIYFKKILKTGKRVLPIGHFKALKKEKPDTVIVGEYGFGFWSVVLFRIIFKKQYKIISICDDSYDIACDSHGLHSIARKFGLKFVDGLILCNKKTEEYYSKCLNFKNNYVFPIIHKDESFRENLENIKANANMIISENKLTNKRVFLFVGRIAPEKNIEYLVKSFIYYHEVCPENKLYLIGDYSEKNKNYYKQISDMIKVGNAGDYISFLGRKEGEELKGWFAAGQVFILPSKFEPFGAVVNEALLLGEKVAVSSKAGSSMLINDANGTVLDIDEPYIDFQAISKNVNPVNGIIEDIPDNMPFKYDNLMKGLIEWINKF